MSRKFALIIGNSEYEDASLSQLVTPDADVDALARVLQDPEIGGFDEVTPLVNEPSATIRLAIARFFAKMKRDDLLLLYFSGHGVRDDHGNLYLAVNDTEHDLLSGTAVPAAFITHEMDRSRSRRQVLILDCCHSGAFGQGAKAVTGASVGTATAFEGTGSGRVVLTATDATQYAWEGDDVIGEAENSVFTHYLIQGLQTGEADADANGRITLDELYKYVYNQVVNETPKQTPGKWAYKMQGELVIARNPNPIVKPAELPAEMNQAIESPFAGVREGAVRELARMLRGSDKGLALTAQAALENMKADDSRRVSEAASETLAAYAELKRALLEETEVEREAAERAEADRIAAEMAEAAEQAEAERAETERVAAAQAEADRIAAEMVDAERDVTEKIEAEQVAAQRAEALRVEQTAAQQPKENSHPKSAQASTQEQIKGQRGIPGWVWGLGGVTVLVGLVVAVILVAVFEWSSRTATIVTPETIMVPTETSRPISTTPIATSDLAAGGVTSAPERNATNIPEAIVATSAPSATSTSGPSVVASIPVGDYPAALVWDGENIWVANLRDSTVQKIDPEADAIVGTIPVGRSPVDLAWGGGSLWVANRDDYTVQEIDPQKMEVVATIPIWNEPRALAWDGANLWVANGPGVVIQKIDPLAGAVLTSIPLLRQVCSGWYDLAWDGEYLWVADGNCLEVYRIDLQAEEVLSQISVGVNPEVVAWGGGSLWVASGFQPEVEKIDPTTEEVLMTIQVGERPEALVWDGDNIWVANWDDNTVQKIDSETGEVKATIPVGRSPGSLVWDGANLWVANELGNTVLKIDP